MKKWFCCLSKRSLISFAKGFTFIEVLVGLGIISVLSAGILTTINPARQQQKGNDSKRKSDLGQIQKALDAYYNDHNRYPDNTGTYTIRSVDNTSGTITNTSWGIPWLPYMKQLPSDPQNPTNGYVYVSRFTGQEYMLCTSLQQTQDPQVCNSGNACTRLTDPSAFNVPASSCGGRVCNFCVASSNITLNMITPTPTAPPTPTPTIASSSPTPTLSGPQTSTPTTSGPADTVITLTGSGFAPNTAIYIVWNESQVFIPTTPTNSGGSFSVPFTIPSSTPGSKSIRVTVDSVSSNTISFTVTLAPCSVSPSNRTAWWQFNDGSGPTATDSFGSNNGTLRNGPSWATGGIGGTLSFDGLNDYVEVASTSSLKYQGGNLTLSAWVYPRSSETSGGDIFSKPWNGAGKYNYRIRFNSGTIYLILYGNSEWTTSTPATIPTNTWSHIAVTISSDRTVRIYINGVLRTTTTYSMSSWTPDFGDANLPLAIGTLYPYGGAWAGQTDHAFDGFIDEARIYGRVLSDCEIATLHSESTPQAPSIPTPAPALACSIGNTVTTLLSGAFADFGSHTSIAVPSDGKPVISFYDAITEDARIFKCGDATCSSGNVDNRIDTAESAGTYTSLKIAPDGNPIVAYYDFLGENRGVRVAKCGNASCSSGNTYNNAAKAPNLGQFISMAVPSNGRPVISYYDETNQVVKVTRCGNASCSSGNTTTTLGSGTRSSIAIGADDKAVISYFSSTARLIVVKCNNSSCSSNTSNTVASGNVGDYSSIAVPSDGRPVISYFDGNQADLKVAKCGDASCSTANIATVDSAGIVGLYTSIAVPSDGRPVISYLDNGNLDLKVAKCGNASCSSGNTSVPVDSTGNVGRFTSIAIGADDKAVISYQSYNPGAKALKFAKCGN